MFLTRCFWLTSVNARIGCSPISFTSFANANPFWDEQNDPMPQMPKASRTPQMPPPLSISKAKDPAKIGEATGMSQSHLQSEPYTQSLSVSGKPPPTTFASQTLQITDRAPGVTHDAAIGRETPPRGRMVQHPATPMRALQAVNENEVLGEPKLVRKRSKSPMKRLLGLGKSTSLKDIAGEPRSPAKKENQDGSGKAGQKSWSNKLRHGFLVSNQS